MLEKNGACMNLIHMSPADFGRVLISGMNIFKDGLYSIIFISLFTEDLSM
jgi:hypothetical protein